MERERSEKEGKREGKSKRRKEGGGADGMKRGRESTPEKVLWEWKRGKRERMFRFFGLR